MGTRATLTALATDRSRGLATLERMLGEIEAVEAELSTWRENSALSSINRQPLGVPYPAPRHLCDLLCRSRHLVGGERPRVRPGRRLAHLGLGSS